MCIFVPIKLNYSLLIYYNVSDTAELQLSVLIKTDDNLDNRIFVYSNTAAISETQCVRNRESNHSEGVRVIQPI